jgi:hypothetical protein
MGFILKKHYNESHKCQTTNGKVSGVRCQVSEEAKIKEEIWCLDLGFYYEEGLD